LGGPEKKFLHQWKRAKKKLNRGGLSQGETQVHEGANWGKKGVQDPNRGGKNAHLKKEKKVQGFNVPPSHTQRPRKKKRRRVKKGEEYVFFGYKVECQPGWRIPYEKEKTETVGFFCEKGDRRQGKKKLKGNFQQNVK